MTNTLSIEERNGTVTVAGWHFLDEAWLKSCLLSWRNKLSETSLLIRVHSHHFPPMPFLAYDLIAPTPSIIVYTRILLRIRSTSIQRSGRPTPLRYRSYLRRYRQKKMQCPTHTNATNPNYFHPFFSPFTKPSSPWEQWYQQIRIPLASLVPRTASLPRSCMKLNISLVWSNLLMN